MRNFICLAGLFTIWFSSPASAEPWLPHQETYLSGPQICSGEKLNPKELFHRVEVPINYKHPESRRTSLYYWTSKPFKTELPTVVFINGGPGDTAHNSSFDLPQWNVVFFDQRGNTCSRPTALEDYLSPTFYSSENTARDIDEIRKDLGISKISVYGVSYGTVPAQIYSHLFSDHTRAVVLEGVVFEGGSSLIASPRKRKILQRYFDQLPEPSQQRVLTLSQKSPLWFSAVGSNILYLDNPLESLDHILSFILNEEDESALAFIKNFLPQPPEPSSYGFDHVVMGMLGCQELGMNMPQASSHFAFTGSVLHGTGQNHFDTNYCKPLQLPEEARRLYHAVDYPSTAPITYIQGTLDGATTADAAIKHFKSSESRSKHLILVKDGGHLPAFGAIGSGYEKGPSVELRQELLSTVLSGTEAPLWLLQALRLNTDLLWTPVPQLQLRTH